MKYYTVYAKDHPRLDRFIHFVSRFVLAALAFVGTYVLQMLMIYRTRSVGYSFSDEWTETGPSIFYSPIMLVAPIGVSITALLAPDVYRRVRSKPDSQ